MSSINYDELIGMYDTVEAQPVQASGTIPGGWYPLRVEKVLDKGVNPKSGVPRVRMQLRVQEGEFANRVVFADKFLASSPSKRDKDGNEVQRTQEEAASASRVVGAQMKQFMGAIGLPNGVPSGSGPEKLFGYFNTDAWEGCEFMGRVKVRKGTDGRDDNNDLGDAAHVNDVKYGLEAWRSKQGSKVATTNAVRL